MTVPTSTADFGTVVPGFQTPATACSRRTPGRFEDVKAYVVGAMPNVRVGDVYADLDPRRQGRRVQVLRVGGDDKVMVRTLTNAPSRPVGEVSFISLRRFTENTRGFKRLYGTPTRAIQSYLLASRIAAAAGIALTETEERLADALIGLLGRMTAHEYLDDCIGQDGEALRELYLSPGGIGAVLSDALAWSRECDLDTEWSNTVLATPCTAATVAAHTAPSPDRF